MFKTTLQISALALAVVLAGLITAAVAAVINRSAAAGLDHHIRAFAAGDLDAMRADYIAGSVLPHHRES
jgi:hypothetical protein